MKNLKLTICFCLIAFCTNAQTKEITFYKDKYCSKKTSAEKGEFSLTIIKNLDGTIETIKQSINSDKFLETYKNDEQIGVWKNGNKIKNFDFEVHYNSNGCTDTVEGINATDLFANNDTLNYKAPIIATGEKDLYSFLGNEVEFPEKALNEGISGKSYLFFQIDENGMVHSIEAGKGGYIFFDKEVIRILRKLKISAPATLNNKAIKICVKLPFKFTMQ